MIVSELNLHNFRNYKDISIKPNPGLNVLFGQNGQGKTNLVEALYLCACARSHRTAKDIELIKHNSDNYKIDLKYFSSKKGTIDYSFERQLGLFYGKKNGSSSNQRILFKDYVQLSKTVDFVGNFHAVMFAPEDLEIVKSGPAVRRRFLDLLLSQIKSSYFVALQNYFRILKQRNNLLKNFRDAEKFKLNEFDSIQLDIWDEELINIAVYIVNERIKALAKISEYARSIHKHISDGREYISFKYISNTKIHEDMDEAEMKEAFNNRLKQSRSRDIALGSTSSGPHRDDFDIYINEYNARNYASQGQQRTIVLALKMAELQIIEDITNEVPILLLDDVLSELDQTRREKLINSLDNTQIFITTTDPEQLDKNWLNNSKKHSISYFKVDSASVEELSK